MLPQSFHILVISLKEGGLKKERNGIWELYGNLGLTLLFIEDRKMSFLDLKMLESVVSDVPFDWFSLSGWPRFQ